MSLLNDMRRDLAHQHKPNDALSAGTLSAGNQANPDLTAQEQRDLFKQSSAAKPLARSVIPSLVAFFIVLAVAIGWRHWIGVVANDAVNERVTETVNASETDDQPVKSAQSLGDELIEKRVQADPELVVRLAALETAVTTLADAITDKTVMVNPAVESSPIEESFDAGNSDSEINGSVSVKDPFAVAEHQSTIVTGQTNIPQADLNIEPDNKQNDVQSITSEPVHLAIAPNAKWQDEEQARLARESVAQGQATLAIDKLQVFIATAKQPHESVKALLDIRIDQADYLEVESLLAKANFLSPAEQVFYQAKMLVSQQREDQAMDLLETHLADAEKDENYRALLAGLYQKNGKPLEAANHYRRLLTVFGDKPAYWLGFALSQDALNQPQAALQAYQRVNQYNDLPPQVQTYIQQRLAALQQ
jgi:MSHA biogenesis protein MshN